MQTAVQGFVKFLQIRNLKHTHMRIILLWNYWHEEVFWIENDILQKQTIACI